MNLYDKAPKWQKRIEYGLVVLLVLLSGSPVLNIPILYGCIGVFFFLYSIQKARKKREKLWIYLLFLGIIFVGQKITLGTISYLGSINVIAKIITGATIMWILKERFRWIYLDVMYYFALCSIVFFTLNCIGISIPDLFPTVFGKRSILIYTELTRDVSNSIRNSGPFWEPGAFACYLVLIPLLFIDELASVVNMYKKKIVILFIALLTTFSTTGYLCITVVLGYYILNQTKYKLLAYIVLFPLFIATIGYAFSELDFLNNKILNQFSDSQNLYGDFSNTRFGSLMFDIHYIEKHPIVGNGLLEQTRYADHKFLIGINRGHGNGFSNYMVQMGIIAVIVYFIMLYKAVSCNPLSGIIVVIVILMLLQGEQLMNYPLFLSLPFVIFNRDLEIIKNVR